FLTSGFTSVNYRGAFGADDWTTGWTNFQPDTASYTMGYLPVSVRDVNKTVRIQVFPNPSTEQCRVSFTAPGVGDVTLEVSDINGRVVARQEIKAVAGYQQVGISTAQFQDGLYMIRVQGKDWMSTQKLSVMH
ncbi:MAG: T9SS type A sorting domain-containing protein, partial [Chitinophagaceae bacterium]|nr:T9SS type A sorting domain-containing protein [Chitinophagaceae bacterium]